MPGGRERNTLGGIRVFSAGGIVTLVMLTLFAIFPLPPFVLGIGPALITAGLLWCLLGNIAPTPRKVGEPGASATGVNVA